MKLLAIGLVQLAAATAMLFITYLDPATLFIGGAVCTFLGVIHLIAPPGTGVAVSADAVSETNYLANLQNYGSVDRSARLID